MPAGGNACTDGIDNDGNGYIDADDPHCQSEVLCQDGINNDAQGGTDGADTDCMCLIAASGLNNPPCTAGDITIAYTATPIVSDGCINTNDDTIVAQLTAAVTAHTPTRYDIGMWMALSGGSALDGSLCTRQILQEVAAVGGTPDRLSGTGPYLNVDGDRCGDETTGQTSQYIFPYTATLPCTDQLPNGFVDIGQCGSWDNNANSPCANPSQALPGTGSKCRCERNDSPIPGPNVRTVCTNFDTPTITGGNGGPSLDPGEKASFSLAYTNTVAGCTSGAPVAPDVFGRNRCGTASFVRYEIGYTPGANARGFFTYGAGNNCADVAGTDVGPDCVPVCPTTQVVGSNNGVLCNDTANSRLIWAPRDVNVSNTYAVISAFAGTQSLPFAFTLTDPVGTAAINFSARIFWDDAVDTAPTDGTITDAEAVSLIGAIPQTCADCSCGTTLQTTPVTLASFEAVEDGRQVRFDWSTATEVGNLGFDLYAIANGERFKLNRQPIPATSPDSVEPQGYSASFFVPEGAESFEVVDLDIRGKERRHGPFELGLRYGKPAESEPVDWSSIRRELGVKPSGSGQAWLREAGRSAERKPLPGAGQSVIELLVDRTGLYRVTYEDLLAAGFDLNGQASSKLGLTSRGAAVPVYVSSTGPFGPGAYIEFYGEALDTIYTHTNVYQLRTGEKSPLQAATSRDRPAGATALSYRETRRFERENDYSVSATSPDPFYDTRMLVYTSPGSWNLPFQLDGLDASGAAPVLRAEMYGGTDLPGISPDHAVELEVNGVAVGAAAFDGFNGGSVEAALPAGLLVDGPNQLSVRLPATTGAPYDLVYFDGFSVEYSRQFAAVDGRLEFQGNARRFDVFGLPGSDVVAYRRESGRLTRLENVQVSAVGGGYQATVPGATGAADYSVASVGSLLSPAMIRAARPATGLLSGSADYLVISHPTFRFALGDLVAARQAQGLSVKVVDVEDVYAAFSGGVYDAQAIRDYIAAAHQTLGTRYVLLVGGDTYDYFDRLGLGALSFVPSLYVATGDVVRHAPSDSLYADVDGDGVQDLAIGRFPVRTLGELAAVIDKTLQFDAKTYGATAMLTADYTDGGANQPFRLASQRMRNELPPNWLIDSVNLDEVELANARAALFWGFNEGTSFINYVGHSGFTHWGSPGLPTSQQFFTLSDVSALTNSGRPAVVSQLGCWNTYFVSPRTESLGARLILTADRGAAAVTGAATLTDDAAGNDFGVLLAARLGEPGRTLGDAWWLAKQDLAAGSPPDRDLRDVLLGWSLLGDPALHLAP